jgi:hypothetical protein
MTTEYTIQPYNMNGLNWRVVRADSVQHNIIVATGFMPEWWQAEHGICFGREFHLNPIVHRDTLARMDAILSERFGDLPNFFCGDDYANSWPMERRYGDGLMLAVFGGRVAFDDASGHPHPDLLSLSDEEALGLSAPDVENSPVLKLLFEDWREPALRRTGELGFEGLINILYYLRGQQVFLDVHEGTDVFRHLSEVVSETLTGVVRRFRRWQDPVGAKPTHFVNCDCLINMLSPKTYRERLLQYEHRFHESFDLFGIHTCNWTVDPYLDALAEIAKLDYLDMGPDSDLDKVHQLFPELRPSVFVKQDDVRHLPLADLKKKVAELCRRLGRGYLLLADLPAGTSDDSIRMIYEVAASF